jgi:hypothetical protein
MEGINKLPIVIIRDDLVVVVGVGEVRGVSRNPRAGETLRCRLNLLLAVSSIVIE